MDYSESIRTIPNEVYEFLLESIIPGIRKVIHEKNVEEFISVVVERANRDTMSGGRFNKAYSTHQDNCKSALKELIKQNKKGLGSETLIKAMNERLPTQVDKAFLRKPDTNDRYQGMQVYHYEVTEKFRIHVVLESRYYKIIRLDPKHKVHGG